MSAAVLCFQCTFFLVKIKVQWCLQSWKLAYKLI